MFVKPVSPHHPDHSSSSSNNDFSQGPMWRNILTMAVPLILAQAVQVLYNVVDRVYIGHLPADAALCLYAGLREEYAAPDSTRCLATRDIRLARRLVRDCLFRGHGAAFTLGLWGKVCAGEDQYIKPFKPRADLLLDTTHTYEVCLWHALLDTMPPDEDLTATQRRQLDTLRARFAAFPPLDTALVPADSMLREFIGA